MNAEDRLLGILGSWREHRSRGEAITPASLIAAHPEFAEELRACFETLEALDEALAEEVPTHGSVLARLSEAADLQPIVLRDPDQQEVGSPVLKQDSSDARGSEGRYQILGEIARGGVGVVLKGHDLDLGRSVAMKVILKEHQANPDVVQRFVEEAQIGGQLQHPGIVPVYEIGLREDRRPYFTMKLIKGKTLAELLVDRDDVGSERRRFLSIMESVCQTVAYAHARGVVHRDLKPANVMVGAFGEVLVVDWGMGKVLRRGGVEDERKSLAKADRTEVHTVRSDGPGSESIVGSVLGTLRYMPPEQARGHLARVDERSDVFSLGATLCEILTGDPPYRGDDREALLRQALEANLEDAYARLERCGADEALVRLTTRCLSPAQAARPKDAGVVAAEIGTYLADVEERAHRAQVEAAEARAKAAEEEARAGQARAVADQERLRATHARRARRAGMVALLATIAVGLAVVVLIEGKRREAQRARDATQRALERVLRLSDSKRARDLSLEAETLWPVRSAEAAAMDAWLGRARVLLAKKAGHEATLAELEGRVRLEGHPADPGTASEESAWQHQVVADLLRDLREIERVVPAIERRHAAAVRLQARLRDVDGAAWTRTIRDIQRSDRYAGVKLEPLEGLVPLGPDPDSGLFEFAHVGSGALPARDPGTRRLMLGDDSAIVLVLIPGGGDLLGAQSHDPNGPGYDPLALADESPVHEVRVGPFLIGKHEVTQAQWIAMTDGQCPSYMAAGEVWLGDAVTERHPVDSVSWDDCKTWLRRHRLDLPTEVQWEYACRAGTDGPRYGDLAKIANIADARYLAQGGPQARETPNCAEWDDGHSVHAPVGSFLPNAFGLFDMLGNVMEWCEDEFCAYGEEVAGEALPRPHTSTGRVMRGLSYRTPVPHVRCSRRMGISPGFRNNQRGVRAALSWAPANSR